MKISDKAAIAMNGSLFYIVSVHYIRKKQKNFVCFGKSCTFASRLLSNSDKFKIQSTLILLCPGWMKCDGFVF